MIRFGTDPEYLIVDNKNQPVPAHLFFPGSKDAKWYCPIKGRGLGSLFRDGYALELNVPPSNCRSVLTDNVRFMLSKAKKFLPRGYRLVPAPAWPIRLSSLRGAPSDVQQFGCDPAFDAYTGEERRIELDGERHPYRYAGGHLHFSVDPVPTWMKNFGSVRMFVKYLDLYVGLPLTHLYHDPPTFLRRRFYGRAGEFRLQNYPDHSAGVEYRVPDPRVWNHQAVAMMALGIGRDLLRQFRQRVPLRLPVSEVALQRAINEGDNIAQLLRTRRGWYSRQVLNRAAADPRFQIFKPVRPVPAGTECDFAGWSEWLNDTLVP